MSDIDTLHDRLSSLVQDSASFSGRERVLIHAGEADPRDAMRLEISETQLPRRIIFRTGDKTEISFEVTSGRIFKVVHPTSSHLFAEQDHANLLDAVLETDGNATQLPSLIDAFLSSAEMLTVETHFLQNPTHSLHFGISANALFSQSCAPKSESNDSHKGEALIEFLESCSTFSTAGLLMARGRAKYEFGSKDNLALLREILLAETSVGVNSQLMQMDSENGYHCAIYTGHPTGALCALCASHANDLALVIFESSRLDQILRLAKF